ncbi:hypothetical protein [Roseivirga sp. E12]|uniref:hypothetical protein n=1 Tax=Roseivirga sp. E12 TaxID=2819237 RepID=UPI001ABD0C17|nr:hypothetical protein [Roseivirga sp. E12]MBO3699170.1 hypothetical protein [Roseivirga sp. E12]
METMIWVTVTGLLGLVIKLIWKYIIIAKVLQQDGPVEIEMGSKKNPFKIKKDK